MLTLLKYLLVLILGVLFGFLLTPQNTIQNTEPQTQLSINGIVERDDNLEPMVSNKPISRKSEVAVDVSDKDRIILQLKKKIKTLQFALSEIKKHNKKNSKGKGKLEIVSMKQLETSMTDTFMSRFQHMVIESEGTDLDRLKSSFERDKRTNEWSRDYQEKVMNFINNGDPNNSNVLQGVECHSRMCKLDIYANDLTSWGELYSKMTEQNWYNGVTMLEKTDDPSTFTYYIENLKFGDADKK